ncbi:MAG TPA: DUF5682 family protein, partial [Fimbriimonas sp.]|nr:DUF5682 family protein [Fimbriimonas sp.]
MAETRIYGIRHHGPGSARSLLRELEAFQPDAILIEMPAEAESALTIANHPEIKPPVALLIYSVENPKEASFYPMAEFSPEWNAIRFGLSHDIPIKAIDLPAGYRLTKEDEAPQERFDVFSTIAEAAGYTDGELWWEHTFEQRWSDLDPFEAV